MHELQLMRQVVRLVEEKCHTQPGNIPLVIRLQVTRHSHLAERDSEELQATFHLAAQGSRSRDRSDTHSLSNPRHRIFEIAGAF